jgi:hypothetical protein
VDVGEFPTDHKCFLWTGREFLPQPQSASSGHGDGAGALLHGGKGEKVFTPLDGKNAIGNATATFTPSILFLPLLLLSAVSRTSIDSPGHSNFNFVPNQR